MRRIASSETATELEHGDSTHRHVGFIGSIGMSLHSFLDGVALAAGLAVGGGLGLVIAFVVVVHRFSDGIGIVSLLLASRTPRNEIYRWVGLVALAPVVGVIVGLLALPASPLHQAPTLGLDLQGGLEVTLQAVPPRDRELTQEDLDRSVEIIRNRVDKIGVSEPEIRKQGDNQIVVGLAGVFDQARAADLIGQTAQLEFYDLAGHADPLSLDGSGNPLPSPTRRRPLVSRSGRSSRSRRGRDARIERFPAAVT